MAPTLDELRAIATGKFLKEISRINLMEAGILKGLERRPPDAMAPDTRDMWFLYKMVLQHKPKIILEFGSGCSTQAMAHALLKNDATQPGYLYALETEPHYLGVTRDHIPEHLQEFYEVIPSGVEMGSWDGWQVTRHTNIPDIVPDMIYLDSPAFKHRRLPDDVSPPPGARQYMSPLRMDGSRTPPYWCIAGTQIDVSLLDIEDRLEPGCHLYVDGREDNREFLFKYFKRKWKYQHNPVINNSCFTLIE